MSDQKPDWGGSIRKLWPTETGKFRDHLLRLDKECRRLRFAHAVSDRFVEDYADRLFDMGSIVFACFEKDEIIGTAELRKLGNVWGRDAEAAFSVERPYQHKGMGTELMGRVIVSARNRGVRRLYMSCLSENTSMQAIARKYEASLQFEYGDVIGEILPANPDYFTIFSEAMEDRVGYMLAVFDLQGRLIRAA